MRNTTAPLLRGTFVKPIHLIKHLILIVSLSAAILLDSKVSRAQASNIPALLVAQGLNDSTIQLTWMAVTGADNYKIYRGQTLLATQPGTLFNDTSLNSATTYSYRVSAIVGGTESPRSDAVSATTQAAEDSSPPTQPGAITVTNLSSSGAALNWPASSDNVGIVGYRVLRGAAGAPVTDLVQIATTDGGNSYTVTNLRANTIYQFAVLGLDPSNNLSLARTVSFTTSPSSDTTAPDVPSGSIALIVFSSSRIDLTWDSSPSSDVSAYQVFRDGVLVGEVALPFRRYYSDNGLAPASKHSYQVRAVDSAGNVSALTTARSATTTASGTVKIVRGPYVQWTTDNSTRIAWWTNIPAPSMVNYGVGSLSEQVSDPILTTQHMMLIGGLVAGLSYSYQAVSGSAASGTSSFRTAASPGSTFSFAAVGDYGGGSPQEKNIANNIAAGGTEFVQTLGDNVYPDAQDPDFVTTYSDFDGRFYKQYASVIKQQTFWPANGNKDYYGDGAHWQNFWLPNNERWYSYDWGDAHILVLDSQQPFTQGTPQYQFAQSDLSAHQSQLWRIVIFHKPPYSSASGSTSSTGARAALVPLFEQQNVQLVLSGNNHNYERTYPLLGGVPQTSGGITYIVSGGGGNGLNQFNLSQPSWSAFRQATYEHVRITVSTTALQIEAIAETGVLLDTATIPAPGAPATNTPTTAPTATAAPSGTPTPTNAFTATPTMTPVDTATATATPTATLEPSPSPTSTATPVDTATPTTAPTLTATPLATATPTTVPSATATPSLTPTSADVPTLTSTPSPIPTSTVAFTATPTSLATQTPAAGPLFRDDFESGNLSQWTGGSGLLVQQQEVYAGSYAARATSAGAASWSYKQLSSAQTDLYYRLNFKIISQATNVYLLKIRTGTGTSILGLYVSSTGKLAYHNDITGTTITSTTSVPSGGWHDVQIHVLVNGSAGQIEVWFDGLRVNALQKIESLGTDPVGRIQLGDNMTSRTFDVAFDNVIVDIQPIGN